MSLYNNYIGIDIGKLFFVVAVHGSKKTYEYENTPSGIKAFINDFKIRLKPKNMPGSLSAYAGMTKKLSFLWGFIRLRAPARNLVAWLNLVKKYNQVEHMSSSRKRE